MADYNEVPCKERHKRIEEKMEVQDRRLNSHSPEIDQLKQNNSRMEERLNGLIQQLGTLNTTLKWFIGLMIGAFVSFFFYAIQNKLF